MGKPVRNYPVRNYPVEQVYQKARSEAACIGGALYASKGIPLTSRHGLTGL